MMNTPDYEKGINYWSNIEASFNGVLGGFEKVHDKDASGSRTFIRMLYKFEHRPTRALDCGAGVGRVTKDVLAAPGYFDVVDLVEPVESFVNQAKNVVLKDLIKEGKIGTIHTLGLQKFNFTQMYDFIWCQWCLGHVSDNDLIEIFKRSKDHIKPGGYLVVKENVCIGYDQFDPTDSSITRTDESFKRIFEESGFTLVREQEQHGLPKELFTVKMYALQIS